MNVLIILGHPRKESLCGALAKAYHQGVVDSGHPVQMIAVTDLKFEPNVYPASIKDCVIEDDLRKAIDAMIWADHLVFVYPAWWGTMPALLKGFLDRTLLPGTAFARRSDGGPMIKLWKGKTAQLINTLDTPLRVYHKVQNAPGDNAMRHSALGFCGIEPVHVKSFTPARDVTADVREAWIEEVRQMGISLKDGFHRTKSEKFQLWVKALRLQFYIKTFVAYTLGAVAAILFGVSFSWLTFLLGYGVVFALEAATVFSNEYFDSETDKLNQHFTSMSGGSRVLVDGLISSKQLLVGMTVSLLVAAGLTGLLFFTSPSSWQDITLLFALSTVLSLGYTMPPLRLSYRTLGEIDLVIVNSFLAIGWAFVLQGGALLNPFAWLLGVPLALATLPSIIMAGVPDREADAAVGKKTLAVRLGVNGAVKLAIVLLVLSVMVSIGWLFLNFMLPLFIGVCVLSVPSAYSLIRKLSDYHSKTEKSPLVNPLIGMSLMYSLWFSVVPLTGLLMLLALR